MYKMSKPVILTGLRANNDLHIGNYFGALLPMIDMMQTRSGEYDINLFVPDLHSFTTPIDHTQLQAQILHNLKLFVAAGLPLDNPDIHVYRQSYISAHSELTWILDNFTGFGEMSRMTQFKDKSKLSGEERMAIYNEVKRIEQDFASRGIDTQDAKNWLTVAIESAIEYKRATTTVGLFNYPVLMAADILLYGASYVPVGDDQSQHLEFARDIAERMNNKFGELLIVPEPVKKQHEFFGKEQGLRIKDLSDPAKKMSKSDESGKGIIFLGDAPAEAAKKIMRAETDSFGEIKFDFAERPGISNLLQILALLTNRPLTAVVQEWEGKPQYGDLKKVVADAVEQFLVEFQTRLSEVNEQAIFDKLAQDEAKMNEVANATLLNVQKAVGLR